MMIGCAHSRSICPTARWCRWARPTGEAGTGAGAHKSCRPPPASAYARSGACAQHMSLPAAFNVHWRIAAVATVAPPCPNLPPCALQKVQWLQRAQGRLRHL